MATGDAMRVALVGDYLGEPAIITFGLVEGTGGADPNPLANAALAVQEALGGANTDLAGFAGEWHVGAIQVADIQPGTRPSFSLAQNHFGSEVTGTALPGMCAGIITWQTDVKGPANRGRMYVPGLLESVVDGNFLNSDGQDTISAFASLIFDPFVTDGTAYQLNVLSYVPGSSPRALRAAVPVTAFKIQNVVRSQRRRGQGVRIHRRP